MGPLRGPTSRSYLAVKYEGLNRWLFHIRRGFQHFTAGVAGTEMNCRSALFSSLASRILWRYFYRAFFFFGVEHSVADITAVPCSSLVLPAQRKQHYRSLHFLGVGLSVVNLRSAILGC